MRNESGLTLVEMMIVTVVISVMMSLAASSVSSLMERKRTLIAINNIKLLQTALDYHYAEFCASTIKDAPTITTLVSSNYLNSQSNTTDPFFSNSAFSPEIVWSTPVAVVKVFRIYATPIEANKFKRKLQGTTIVGNTVYWERSAKLPSVIGTDQRSSLQHYQQPGVCQS